VTLDDEETRMATGTPRKRTAPAKEAAVDEVTAKALAVLDGDLPEGPDDEDETAIPEALVFSTGDAFTDEELEDLTPEEEVQEFEVDGMILVATKPEQGAFTLILGALSNAATIADRTNAILQFVQSSLDEPSRMYVMNRLLAKHDKFDVELLAKIVNQLLVKWAPKQSRAQRRASARRRR
jgi:hypothetical protein